MDEDLERCVKSLDENNVNIRYEARQALLDICHNVLKSPHDDKSRELRLDNEIVIEKLLPAVGAMECLFDIGYIEDGERIFLPRNVSLSRLETLSRLLSTVSQSNPVIENIVNISSKQKFFNDISGHFHNVMHYEDFDLQRKARHIIPIRELEIAAMIKMRKLQKSLKSNGIKEVTSLQFETEFIATDFFLTELLHWFKYKFFRWVNSPICSECLEECIYESMELSTNPYCSRVELHRCKTCNIIMKFPRYSHPKPLLLLRRGRCGEWANVFTLLCRSLGYDARLVCDMTDHVWTEIWSMTRKEWIHVDPCENVIDKPLMYEKGWKKKLTYIIAYSRDEVQDVTWRYTRNQKAVMQRRKLCTEQSLIEFLRSLSEQRQNSAGYSQTRKEYVIKRSLLELASTLCIPNSQNQDSDENYEGRTSGSLAWRLARGEIAQTNAENYIWNLSKYKEMFELQYNIIDDVYYVMHNGITLKRKSTWLEGINTMEGGIFRKVENDWKMVYLARSPQAEYGYLKWTFETINRELNIEKFSLKAKSETFHQANVSWEIEAIFSDDKMIVISVSDCKSFCTEEVRDAIKLNVIVKLSGGEGELAWQHAQLFRQSMEKTDEPSMIINIQLKNCA